MENRSETVKNYGSVERTLIKAIPANSRIGDVAEEARRNLNRQFTATLRTVNHGINQSLFFGLAPLYLRVCVCVSSLAPLLSKVVCYTRGLTKLETRYCSFSPLCCFSYVHFVLICTVVVLCCFVMCVCVCVWGGVGFVMCVFVRVL